MPAWSTNRLTSKLEIDYPIIQGPLGGLSSQRLTAAVSNFGGMGSFGAHGLSPAAIKDVIAPLSKGASRHLRSTLRHWGCLSRYTSPIRRRDLKIRLTSCWTRTCQHSASSMEFRHEKSWTSADERASSRLAPRRRLMRRRHFRRLALTPSSPLASKPVGIAAHFSGPWRIRLWVRCRSFLRSSTS